MRNKPYNSLTEEQRAKRRENINKKKQDPNYKPRKYNLTTEQREKRILKERLYRINFKDDYNKDRRERYRLKKLSDPYYSLNCSIRALITFSIKRSGYKKKNKTEEILGCTINEFILYLENQFEPWMNWSNYGNWNGIPTEMNTAWDIDHIIPSSFATSEDDVIKLNHYTNLRPLFSYVNRYIKGDRVDFNTSPF